MGACLTSILHGGLSHQHAPWWPVSPACSMVACLTAHSMGACLTSILHGGLSNQHAPWRIVSPAHSMVACLTSMLHGGLSHSTLHGGMSHQHAPWWPVSQHTPWWHVSQHTPWWPVPPKCSMVACLKSSKTTANFAGHLRPFTLCLELVGLILHGYYYSTSTSRHQR